MNKEKYILPLIEVVEISDNVISTSGPAVDPFDPWDDDDPGTDVF